jgi:hypothetical protein
MLGRRFSRWDGAFHRIDLGHANAGVGSAQRRLLGGKFPGAAAGWGWETRFP